MFMASDLAPNQVHTSANHGSFEPQMLLLVSLGVAFAGWTLEFLDTHTILLICLQRYEAKKRSERKAEVRTAKEEEKAAKAEQMREKELREYKNIMKVS